MEKEDIKIGDIHRILFGEAPELFLVEVLGRSLFIYFLLLVAVRLMGKRMSGQLTISEMAIMVMLGAIVSPAMQLPNVGILQGALILLTSLFLYRGWNYLEFVSPSIEKMNHGKVILLVKDGILMLNQLNNAKLSRQQLFAELRKLNIYNLGQVERVYLEAFGLFSIYKFKTPRAGLPILPPDDKALRLQVGFAEKNCIACASCGKVTESHCSSQPCELCESNEWVEATTLP